MSSVKTENQHQRIQRLTGGDPLEAYDALGSRAIDHPLDVDDLLAFICWPLTPGPARACAWNTLQQRGLAAPDPDQGGALRLVPGLFRDSIKRYRIEDLLFFPIGRVGE